MLPYFSVNASKTKTKATNSEKKITKCSYLKCLIRIKRVKAVFGGNLVMAGKPRLRKA